jgi:hypothetical protein
VITLKSVFAPARLMRVPNNPKTPNRTMRVPDEDWDDMEAPVKAAGTDRTKVVNQFIRWYLRRPGARLPERPPARGRADDE